MPPSSTEATSAIVIVIMLNQTRPVQREGNHRPVSHDPDAQGPAEHLASLLGQGPLLPGAQQKVGQQYGTAEHNQLVELTAMEIVTASYEAEHYIVRDVSKQRLGWDLEARRGGTVSHIEVKGTTGPLPEFFLTPNEHRAASDQTGWVAVVVTKIFGAEPACHEFSGPQVTAAAKPTQYLVKAGP